MRPDRVVVGEVRGAEVMDMLQAMNTGHEGSMATIHANSPRECLYRIEMLAGFAGFQGSEDSLRRQIASALDFIVQIGRLSNGKRRVLSVTEVTGMGDNPRCAPRRATTIPRRATTTAADSGAGGADDGSPGTGRPGGGAGHRRGAALAPCQQRRAPGRELHVSGKPAEAGARDTVHTRTDFRQRAGAAQRAAGLGPPVAIGGRAAKHRALSAPCASLGGRHGAGLAGLGHRVRHCDVVAGRHPGIFPAVVAGRQAPAPDDFATSRVPGQHRSSGHHRQQHGRRVPDRSRHHG
ncbi:hypothetical protein G6F65_017049 [Rhizopus arrhizus]|nr:hypothetical protein G6F65_017049 [Rhizopus arrhizus]